jgi:hypothetical protein
MQLIDRASVDSLKTKNLEKKIEPFQWGKSTLVVFPPARAVGCTHPALLLWGCTLTLLRIGRYYSE